MTRARVRGAGVEERLLSKHSWRPALQRTLLVVEKGPGNWMGGIARVEAEVVVVQRRMIWAG